VAEDPIIAPSALEHDLREHLVLVVDAARVGELRDALMVAREAGLPGGSVLEYCQDRLTQFDAAE
jgi:hypothetical protein